jgi:hypothetical protein
MGVLRSIERFTEIGFALGRGANLLVDPIVCPFGSTKPDGQRRCRRDDGENQPSAREAE